jgi:hypothetical protein
MLPFLGQVSYREETEVFVRYKRRSKSVCNVFKTYVSCRDKTEVFVRNRQRSKSVCNIFKTFVSIYEFG